jgi:hypothetical protein
MKDKPANFPVAFVLELSAIGVAPASLFPALQTLANGLEEHIRAHLETAGASNLHKRWAEVRPATREELLNFVPRKVHFTEDGTTWVCTTAHVSRKNLTANREEVTCRLCRHKLGLLDPA